MKYTKIKNTASDVCQNRNAIAACGGVDALVTLAQHGDADGRVDTNDNDEHGVMTNMSL